MRLKVISIGYLSVIILIVVLYLWHSRSMPTAVAAMPWFAGAYTLIMCLLLLATDIKRLPRGHSEESEERETGSQMDIESTRDMSAWVTYKQAASKFAWIPATYAGIWLFGFHIGMTIFFIVYLTFKARVRWFLVPGLTVLMVLFLFYFDKLLNVWWPEGLLEQWVNLPWSR